MLKTCTQCNVEKETTEFYHTSKRRSKIHLYGYCKICAINKVKNHQLNFKQACLEYKQTNSCISCGYNKHTTVLDFHHLDPSQKEFNISKYKKYTNISEDLKQELDKCIVLCSNCHREIHLGFLEYKNNKIEKINITTEIQEWVYFKDKPKQLKPKNIQNNTNQNTKERKSRPTKIEWPSNQELTKIVFEKPIYILAKELGVSDVAIVKHCKKYNIERPKRGHWLSSVQKS